MEKKPTVIIFICSLIGLLIFLILWISIIIFPFLDWAQLMASLGLTYGGPISILLEYLFLNVYFIGTAVCGIIALIFRIITRKSV